MTPGVVVGGILLPGNHLLRVEQLAVSPGSNLVHDSRLQIKEDSPEHKNQFEGRQGSRHFPPRYRPDTGMDYIFCQKIKRPLNKTN